MSGGDKINGHPSSATRCHRMPSAGFIKRRSKWISILLLVAFLQGGVFMPHPFVSAKTSKNNGVIRPPTTISSKKHKHVLKSAVQQHQKNSTLLLQIIETEVFTNGTWHHPMDGSSAWTHPSTGAAMVHPLQYELLNDDDNDRDVHSGSNQKQWRGEWKIAITGRSSRGWTYYYNKPATSSNAASPLLQYTIRRRTWLRTIIVIVPSPQKTATTVLRRRARRRIFSLPRPLSILADDWNFKGFGWTIYKSAVSPYRFGLGLRIPLTQNFASWETYQIPASLGVTISAYNVWQWPALHFNASIRMEWLQWALDYTLYILLPALVRSALLMLLHGLLVALNALLYPVLQKSVLDKNDAQPEWLRTTYWPAFRAQPIRYRSDREERVGISWTWRLGDRRKLIRWSVFHFYAWQLPSLLAWITRRSAAIGWSVSGPVPNEPELLCSASLCFLLSGYYFQRSTSRTDLSSSSAGAAAAAAAAVHPDNNRRTNGSFNDGVYADVITVPPSPSSATATAGAKDRNETKRQVAGALMK
jgi:hypothetical protein